MNFSEPFLEPYSRHILVCVGGFCSPDRRGRELYALLPTLLQREGLLFGPGRVKRGETPCLGVCTGGPIVVVYPDGVWYGRVTPELLERIVVEHLRNGQVVEDAVFFRLGSTQVPPVMDGVLYERILPHGPAVRIRRLSVAGESPVTAVLEVDRRAGTPRASTGSPPPLMQLEGETEQAVMAALEPHARDDRRVVQLMREKGLR